MNVIKSYDDPVSFEPLIFAVNLMPCCHKLNEDTAQKLFGKIVADKVEKPNIPCPLCRKIVVSYGIDHTMRDLVKDMQLSLAPAGGTQAKSESDKKQEQADASNSSLQMAAIVNAPREPTWLEKFHENIAHLPRDQRQLALQELYFNLHRVPAVNKMGARIQS